MTGCGSAGMGSSSQRDEQSLQRREFADLVLKQIEILRVRAAGSQVEFGNVIGISGGRGVGKSTVVRQVCSRLRAIGCDIVLDPVTPRDLGIARSLSSVVLLGLREEIRRLRHRIEATVDEGSKEDAATKEELANHEQRLLGITLSLARSLESSVTQAASTGDEYRWQVVRAEEAAYLAKREFHTWLGEFMSFRSTVMDDSSPRALLVVPLDDFDLEPEYLPDVIGELGRFLLSDRIVVPLAFTDDAMFRAVAQKLLGPLQGTLEALEGAGFTSEELMTLEVDDFISKVVPSAGRVFLPDWSHPLEKLMFRPPGSNETLIDVMRMIPMGTSSSWSSLAQCFDLSDRLRLRRPGQDLIPSSFCDMLPGTARGLRSLHDLMSGYLPAIQAGKLNQEVYLEFLRRFVLTVSRVMPHRDQLDVRDSIVFGPEGRIMLDFRQLDFHALRYTGGRAWGRMFVEGLPRLVCDAAPSLDADPELHRADISREIPAVVEPTVAMVAANRLRTYHTFRTLDEDDSGFSARREVRYGRLMQLLYEIIESNPELLDGYWGDLRFWGTTDWDSTVEITVSGDDSDNLFFIVPDWRHFYPYFVYASAWNDMIESVRGWPARPDGPEDPSYVEALLDLIFLRHLELVACIETGEVFEVGELLPSMPTATQMREAAAERLGIVAQLLDRCASGDLPTLFSEESSDFLAQYLACLIHGLSRLVLSDWLIEQASSRLLPGLLDSVREADQEEDVWDSVFNRARFRPVSRCTAIVLAEHLRLLREFSPDLFEERAESYYQAWTEAVRGRLGGQYEIAGQLVDRGIITPAEAVDLMENGMSPQMTARLAQLDPSLREIVLRVFAPQPKGVETRDLG